MLAASESPAVVEQRNYLAVALQSVALQSDDADLLMALSDADPQDGVIQRRCLAALPRGDLRIPVVRGRLQRAL
jgi:hypothetical protein